MDHMHRGGELTPDEQRILRDIISRSFVSRRTIPAAICERLLAMGLVAQGMGGLTPTPAGRIAARTIP
ncbi:MAG TPA: hypothetical protein VHZ78_12470 [Rhizomicrobium sp.]|jgi:hypothetical protein|nr:hypothetical protein [Rhizomicrobium sp.]